MNDIDFPDRHDAELIDLRRDAAVAASLLLDQDVVEDVEVSDSTDAEFELCGPVVRIGVRLRGGLTSSTLVWPDLGPAGIAAHTLRRLARELDGLAEMGAARN